MRGLFVSYLINRNGTWCYPVEDTYWEPIHISESYWMVPSCAAMAEQWGSIAIEVAA